jgi:hypothetical protein
MPHADRTTPPYDPCTRPPFRPPFRPPACHTGGLVTLTRLPVGAAGTGTGGAGRTEDEAPRIVWDRRAALGE